MSSGRRRRECRAVALPPDRPRRLSNFGVSSGEQTDGPLCNQQHQSPFFSKLAAEIRLHIYGLALSGTPIHIVRMEDRLGHVRCFDTDVVAGAAHDCLGINMKHSTLFHGYDDDTDFRDRDGLISLFKTCKRVYGEAIDLLYSTNHFLIDALETMLILPHTVLSARFNQVKSLDLRCLVSQTPGDHEDWEEVLATLACMRELEQLRIDVVYCWPRDRITGQQEEDLLKPASAIVLTQKWELCLWSFVHPSADDYPQMPFNLSRRHLNAY